MPKYSKKKILHLLKKSDIASTTDEKGDVLEKLICYIFSKIPGVSFEEKNILDGNRAHELDVVFWNIQNKSDLCFLDPVIIVECKNTAHPVGSGEVGWFVRKLQDRGANYGILVALSGITGNPKDNVNAHSEVITAMIRDKIKILLISRDEIDSLCNTDELVELMKRKILKLTIQKTIT